MRRAHGDEVANRRTVDWRPGARVAPLRAGSDIQEAFDLFSHQRDETVLEAAWRTASCRRRARAVIAKLPDSPGL